MSSSSSSSSHPNSNSTSTFAMTRSSSEDDVVSDVVQEVIIDDMDDDDDDSSIVYAHSTAPSMRENVSPNETLAEEKPDKEDKDEEKVTWDGPNDPENPRNWSFTYKWFVTMVCVIMTVNVTFASSAPTVSVFAVEKRFHVPPEVTYLITTMFLLGYTIGPMFWGGGSELVGRRPIFVVALSGYTLFILGQALAPNIQTLLITRFLSGFFAVAPLSNSGGVIADIWGPDGGTPTSVFTAGVFLGPVLGPIIGGFIVSSSLGWRWVFWIMMIFAGACTLVTIVFLPETYPPVLLLKKAKRIRKNDPSRASMVYAEHERHDWSIKGVVTRTIYRPFQMLFMEPILVLITIYLSLVYGVLYCLFEAFPIVYVVRRGFTIQQSGLTFIGVGIGTSVGAYINHLMSVRYPELIKKWRGYPPPEERLWGAMIGGPALVVGALWLGWTGEYASVPWYVPALSSIVIGMSISLIFMSFLSYLVDAYLLYAASAFAANTIVRSAVAAAFPLFTVQMFTKMGINWAGTLLGLVALLLAPSPFLFYKYGVQIRTRSTFAPCMDLKIAKILKQEAEAVKGEKAV